MRNREKRDTPSAAPHPQTNSPNKVHAHIGSRLRRLFDEVVEEPVPEKLRQLLEDLERREIKKPEGQ